MANGNGGAILNILKLAGSILSATVVAAGIVWWQFRPAVASEISAHADKTHAADRVAVTKEDARLEKLIEQERTERREDAKAILEKLDTMQRDTNERLDRLYAARGGSR